MNLVENAVRSTRKGEIFLIIRSRPTATENKIELEFELRDTGSGIPAAKMKQLFNGIIEEDLPGGDETEPKGLGLALCKKLAEIMGGSISVASKPGQGTTFTFSAVFNPALKPRYSPVNPGSSESGKKNNPDRPQCQRSE
jgi:signal transduction histidine kinase